MWIISAIVGITKIVADGPRAIRKLCSATRALAEKITNRDPKEKAEEGVIQPSVPPAGDKKQESGVVAGQGKEAEKNVESPKPNISKRIYIPPRRKFLRDLDDYMNDV